jgi:hypothetical protein
VRTGAVNQNSNGQTGKIPDEVIQARIARRDPNMRMKGPDGYKTVEVSDETRGRIVDFTQSEFLKGYGMSDGEDYMALVKSLAASIPSADRGDFLHTLHQINRDETSRLISLVRTLNPTWKHGDTFDRDVVSKMIANSLDVKV